MKLEGIVLAAGLSSRFPRYKLLENMSGRTMIECTIETMLPYVDHIYVVTGYNRDLIEPLMKQYKKVTCIYNECYQEGMFSSILTGIQHLKCDKFFLTTGDLPSVLASTYELLLKNEGAVIVPSYNMKAGHPILIDAALISPLKDSTDTHLRGFLKNYTKKYVNVLDVGVLQDVDTETDLMQLKRRLNNENH